MSSVPSVKQVAIAVAPTTVNSLREIANDARGTKLDAALGIPGDVFEFVTALPKDALRIPAVLLAMPGEALRSKEPGIDASIAVLPLTFLSYIVGALSYIADIPAWIGRMLSHLLHLGASPSVGGEYTFLESEISDEAFPVQAARSLVRPDWSYDGKKPLQLQDLFAAAAAYSKVRSAKDIAPLVAHTNLQLDRLGPAARTALLALFQQQLTSLDGTVREGAGIFVLAGAGQTQLPFDGFTIGHQRYAASDEWDNWNVAATEAYLITNTPGFAALPAKTRALFSDEVHTLMRLASLHVEEQPLIENGIPGFVRRLGRLSEADQLQLIATVADRHNPALLHE